MMGRQGGGQGQFFYAFDLDAVVPPDHLVRQVDAVLDLSWVHRELAPYYSHTGRPSIDPVLMIRMLIVGYRELHWREPISRARAVPPKFPPQQWWSRYLGPRRGADLGDGCAVGIPRHRADSLNLRLLASAARNPAAGATKAGSPHGER